MRILRFATVKLLIFTACQVSADQYTCESGIVSKEARNASPSHLTVAIVADKSKNTCDFEISGEKVDRNKRASTSVGSGSSGSSSNSSEARSERSRAALTEARQSGFSQYRNASDINAFAPLLFGTTQFPKELFSRFGQNQLTNGLRACLTDISANPREVTSISGGGTGQFRCGSTGTRRILRVDLITAEIEDAPKLYFSFKVSSSEQYAIFIPLR